MALPVSRSPVATRHESYELDRSMSGSECRNKAEESKQGLSN